MKISVITLFPEAFENVFNHSILKRAQEKGLVEFELVNLRTFGVGTHKSVDDRPYGGGVGMILKVDVLKRAIDNTKLNIESEKVVLLDPQGETYKQQTAESFSKLEHLILVCGHYEGFDQRIKKYIDQQISIGDYVLTGGEIPAMVIADSITRLIPHVLRKDTATQTESHSKNSGKRILEGPQYTRPGKFDGEKVPDVLLSGDFKKIEEYKKKTALIETQKNRPDLL